MLVGYGVAARFSSSKQELSSRRWQLVTARVGGSAGQGHRRDLDGFLHRAREAARGDLPVDLLSGPLALPCPTETIYKIFQEVLMEWTS